MHYSNRFRSVLSQCSSSPSRASSRSPYQPLLRHSPHILDQRRKPLRHYQYLIQEYWPPDTDHTISTDLTRRCDAPSCLSCSQNAFFALGSPEILFKVVKNSIGLAICCAVSRFAELVRNAHPDRSWVKVRTKLTRSMRVHEYIEYPCRAL